MVWASKALLIIVYSSTIIAISVIYLKKEIGLDDNFLYIANRKKEVQIPVSRIAQIKSKRGMVKGSWKITVYLKKPSDFGDKVKFLVDAPPNLESDYINSLSDQHVPFQHPLVKELKDKIILAT